MHKHAPDAFLSRIKRICHSESSTLCYSESLSICHSEAKPKSLPKSKMIISIVSDNKYYVNLIIGHRSDQDSLTSGSLKLFLPP
jgi:hypothetical protein